MSTTLTPSNLVQNEYGDAAWWTTQNANITLLNSTLLKLNALGDVNVSGLANFDGLQWNAGASEWINVTTI